MPNPQCGPTVNITDHSATINGAADNVSTLDKVSLRWGTTPGGPYPNEVDVTPGDNTVGEAVQAALTGLVPSTTYYYVTAETVPANYVANWQYAHAARYNFLDETVEVRLIDEDDPSNFNVLVDTHTAGLRGVWTLRAGSTPIPSNVLRLRMSFRSLPGGFSPGAGNFLDTTSVTLTPSIGPPLGEQLGNPDFEIPAFPLASLHFPSASTTPGIAWSTTDGCDCLEVWSSGFNGGEPGGPIFPNTGNQFVEMNAYVPAEFYQITTLDRAYNASVECSFTTLPPPIVIACGPPAETETSAIVAATTQNEIGDYYHFFRYGTTPGGPYDHTTPPEPSNQTSPQSFAAVIHNLTPGTTYYYQFVVVDKLFNEVANSDASCPGANFTTLDAVEWCGGIYPEGECTPYDGFTRCDGHTSTEFS